MSAMTNDRRGDRPKLHVILASTRPGRVGATVAEWIQQRAVEHGVFDVRLVDLLEVGLPFLDEPQHPRLRQYQHQHTRDWSATIDAADAYAFVVPEYNYGMNAPLKNALDFLHHEWRHKPVGFASYGGISGGTRAAQMAKQVVTALAMMPLPEAVTLPFVRNQVHDGVFQPSEANERAATAMLDELARWARALRPLRTGSTVGD